MSQVTNVRTIHRRIRSVQNTAKITRAMEMVAASKMRRAQQKVQAARPYAEKLQEVLADLAAQIEHEDVQHPLLENRTVQRVQVVHITTDRGLCGGLNANMNRHTGHFILESGSPVSLITVGRKGRDFMVRNGRDVKAVFTDIGDSPSVVDALPVARLAIEDYASGAVDQVYVAYARFVNATVQRPTMLQLLPVQPADIAPMHRVGYIYEPAAREVLSDLLPRFVEMQIYHAILEGIASEQSARMVAMRTATDNAHEMVDSLRLLMNKARQESITKDLLDIVGGVAALEA